MARSSNPSSNTQGSLQRSELVLNADGSIYHLALKPEQIAPTVLTVGDPGRVPKVARHFDALEFELEKREFRSCTGRIGERRFTVLSTGIGTDNIDIALNELDALVNLDLAGRKPRDQHRRLNIIRLGTSGSLQADIPVGKLVCSSHGLGLDGLLSWYLDPDARIQFGPPKGQQPEAGGSAGLPWPCELDAFPLPPYLCPADPELLNWFGADFARGITATCPGFYGPQGRSLRLQPVMPDLPMRLSGMRFGEHRVSNFEMETAAIYGLGALLGHRCLSINVILANRINGEFAQNPSALVEDMISQVLRILSDAPLSTSGPERDSTDGEIAQVPGA